MARPEPLTEDQVYQHCPPEQLEFATTEALEALELPCGQERLLRALEFGAAMRGDGFNLFVLGPAGSGRHDLVRRFLERRAAEEPAPPDWCYVFNFDQPECPRAIRLEAGEGRTLQADLERLIEDLRSSIPAAFEAEEYQRRLQELKDASEEAQSEGVRRVQEEAEANDIALISAQNTFSFAPMRDGEILKPEEYDALSEDERGRIDENVEVLQEKLRQALRQIPRLRKELQEKVRALSAEMLQWTLGGPIRELKERWSGLPAVVAHLEAILDDVVQHAEAFRSGHGHAPPEGLLERFRINLLVDHAETRGAPVIYEDLPNHQHLTGQIEHQVHEGALFTDFSLVRAGALHRASGGYLMLDARRVLLQPLAWESLKRVLFSGEVRIESLEHLFGLASTVGLEPEPIPVNPKVVLIGDRLLYYLLSAYDPDFLELFKVEADFEDDLERDEASLMLYARMLATMARRAELRPLDRAAVARVIEHASRLAGDQRKLSAHDRTLRDLLLEADHWAGQAGAEVVGAAQVDQAIREREARGARLQRGRLEQIRRGVVLIATRGTQPAQVNGLSVMQLGDMMFGCPIRITATARSGKGQVVDIEREAKLGGPVHSKAVMILSRFIASHYAADSELSLSASLAFEQSYGDIEGDSASVAEACALLSAIARIPLRQSLAVTGSLNQHGEVQAVGGVNEKIEGFFDVCREAGELDGHGVLLPASNVEHLMLREDVRAAIAQGRFSVYPVTTLDEAIELLADLPAGERDARGGFPKDSFNRAVADRLRAFARLSHRHGHRDESAEAVAKEDPTGEDDT
ncbi:Lon protease family protein [Thioalkalivibrio sp. ALJ16]|uniref:Lon protease family protein n=1 Tax=Thioalkalivibrio sp. ALJ16 TaxID=1158762 RepID=UPI000373ABEF|nr:ATP-binding protein [Thioalkalivibrio sp. ALJ16]